MNGDFDDCLGLGSRDFSRDRLIVFRGMSGSGKSTAIRYLIESHPDFRERDPLIVKGPPFRRRPGRAVDLLVIDELLRVTDLFPLFTAIYHSHTAVIASHLPATTLPLLFLQRRASVLRTDRCELKIGRALDRRGLAHSPQSLTRFVELFGASYTDLEIILERCPADSFDRSLWKFARLCSIQLEDRPATTARPGKISR